MNLAALIKYRQEAEARKGLIEARIKRIEARRFTDSGPTDFDMLPPADPFAVDERLAEAFEEQQ